MNKERKDSWAFKDLEANQVWSIWFKFVQCFLTVTASGKLNDILCHEMSTTQKTQNVPPFTVKKLNIVGSNSKKVLFVDFD